MGSPVLRLTTALLNKFCSLALLATCVFFIQGCKNRLAMAPLVPEPSTSADGNGPATPIIPTPTPPVVPNPDLPSNPTIPDDPYIPPVGPCAENSTDPTCTERDFPSRDGLATAGFEDDNIGGDNDFNDFLFNFRIIEKFHGANLSQIKIIFYPRARAASYNHALKMTLTGQHASSSIITDPLFAGAATIEVKRFNRADQVVATSHFNKTDEIVIFPSTMEAMAAWNGGSPNDNELYNQYAEMTIDLADQAANPAASRPSVDFTKYRFFLYVHNTAKTVELAEVVNSVIDAHDNIHFGMIVPTTWEWPLDRVNITDVYPLWEDYMFWMAHGRLADLSDRAKQWYNNPGDHTENLRHHNP